MNLRRFSVSILLLTALVVPASDAAAGLVRYSGTATANGNNEFVPLSLPKFDANLGTLDSVAVTVDFVKVAGTFSVNSTTSTAATVNDDPSPAVRVTIRQQPSNDLGFTQIGATNFDFSVSQTLPFSVPGNSSQVFDVVQADVISNSSQGISTLKFPNYQSAGGLGSILFEVRNNPVINISGGVFSLDATHVTLQTVMTVDYAYTAAPVPEPSTYAMAAAGFAAAGLARWRRRMARGG